MQNLPSVSVIVPVRNAEESIGKLIELLLAQDYPKSHVEIIIVDNGSQDHTIKLVKQYPVILEIEDKIISSYAARNKGIKVAKGKIIAFTDADCLPLQDWISAGVQALIEQNADMIGGKISFQLSHRPSAAEIIDSVTFMQNEQNILNHHAAVTANLFVYTELFCTVGLFREVKSGGDFQWTQKATQNGYILTYAEQAIVCHPARNINEIIKKCWRVSSTPCYVEDVQVEKQKITNKTKRNYFRKFITAIHLLLPIPSVDIMKLIISKRKNCKQGNSLFTVLCVLYLCKLTQFMALIFNIVRKRQSSIIKDI